MESTVVAVERPATGRGWLALIVVCSFELKLSLVYLAEDMRLIGDQGTYFRMGRQWAQGHGFVVDEANFWPPFQVAFWG